MLRPPLGVVLAVVTARELSGGVNTMPGGGQRMLHTDFEDSGYCLAFIIAKIRNGQSKYR